MAKINLDKVEKSRAKGSEPIDWDKLGLRIGIIVSIATVIGFMVSLSFFMWSFHSDVVSVTEKLGILEGKTQSNCQQSSSDSARQVSC